VVLARYSLAKVAAAIPPLDIPKTVAHWMLIQQAGGKYCTVGRPLTVIQRRPKVAGPMWNH
jgi:hypothetical protein